MDAKLVVVGGEAKSGEIKIKKLPSIVGRGDEADIRLRHPLVSRKHCEIYEVSGLLKVRDLGSLNGTFIANNKIKEATLKPDELITIGPVVFRAVYEGPAEMEAEEAGGDEFDFDLGDEFEAGETQPLDIKKTAAIRETVTLDDDAGEDDGLGDLDFSFDLDDEPAAKPAKKEAAKEPDKKPAAKAPEPADEDDEFADLMAIEVDDDEPATAAKKPAAAAADDDDEFADLMAIEIDEEPEAKPAPKAAGKAEGKTAEKSKPAAKPATKKEETLDEFDIEIDGLGADDDEFDDFLKDIGMEKEK